MSYTWSDDSLKLLALDATERMNIMLRSLEEIYPGVDFRSHIISSPVTLSWETERDFMGAFKANLPGHYRYQERLFSHFVQNDLEPRHRGIFLAGDDVSWTAGWAEGAIQTAINAVWGVVNHLAALRLRESRTRRRVRGACSDQVGRLSSPQLPKCRARWGLVLLSGTTSFR